MNASQYHGSQPLTPGSYVRLIVCDNGKGMDEQTLNRIFEPFFSTKFVGRGLGLAAVLGIVQGHSSGIRVESKPNQGATFTLYLPISQSATVPAPTLPPITETADAHGAVLVIDDEEAVREAVVDILTLEGLEVFSADSGESGVALYQEHADTIDVVLLDLSMPRLSGEQTLHQLRTINPKVKVFICSGYSEEEVLRRFHDVHLAGIVQKPYRMETLLRKIRTQFQHRTAPLLA